MQLSKQGENGLPERLSSPLPDRREPVIQEIPARQDGVPRLQQKEQPMPNSGNNVKVRRLSSFPFVRIREPAIHIPRCLCGKSKKVTEKPSD
ncbi:MAG: hypothetical protein IKS70_02175 [Bacteroides sp.]|nr:hypothetical protein [Bacteroides sp.]